MRRFPIGTAIPAAAALVMALLIEQNPAVAFGLAGFALSAVHALARKRNGDNTGTGGGGYVGDVRDDRSDGTGSGRYGGSGGGRGAGK